MAGPGPASLATFVGAQVLIILWNYSLLAPPSVPPPALEGACTAVPCADCKDRWGSIAVALLGVISFLAGIGASVAVGAAIYIFAGLGFGVLVSKLSSERTVIEADERELSHSSIAPYDGAYTGHSLADALEDW